MYTAPPSSSGSTRLFKRCLAALLIVAIQVQAFAQFTGPILRSGGTAKSGFAKNGTLMFGGQVLGNPHQLMHDMQNPTLWSTGAVGFSNSTDPTFVQATIDQMMQAIAPPSEPGGLFMSRLYLNPENPYTAGGALSAPPSPTPESGGGAPAGPLIDNFEHYKRALAHAQANVGDRTQDITRWSETKASQGDGVSYLAKTHTNSSVALRNTLFDSAPSRAVFQATQVPTAGASAFFALQGAQAKTHLANLQEQNAQLLGSRVFFSQQQLDINSRRFEARLGNPSKSTTLGYIQPDGQAHEFDRSNKHLKSGKFDNLGEALNHAANQHQVRQQALQGLDLSRFKDDRALFMQGLNLLKNASGQDRVLLEGLKNGQITPGHPQYAQARALAQGAFTQAYGDHVEFETRLKHSKESAAWQAQNINLSGISDQALFSQGYNLFDRRASEHQEGLLKRLQAGELKVGSAEYKEARTLAEARFRVDHQQALEPPKKTSSWKKLVSVVVVAVVAFYLGPMATNFAAGMITGATATATVGGVATTVVAGTAGTALTTGAVAATAIGSAAASMASAAIGTAIQTGSVSQGMKAAGNSLKGGLAQVAVTAALAAAGVTAPNLVESAGMSAQVAAAVTNTLSSAITNTLVNGSDLGQNLVNGAINSAVDMVAQNVAGDIGKNTDLGSFEKYLAHAALGCGVGAVRSDSSDGCAPGAAGAVVAHYGAGLLDGTTGYTLSDSEVSFYSSLAGGTAAALVGDKDALEGNFGLGQSAGQNAVDNNYLTERDFLGALERIKACTSGCEVLKKALLRNEAQGGGQVQVGRLEDRCRADPLTCASQVQDIVEALKTLQTPETLALLGQKNVDALVARQVGDLGRAVNALQWGVERTPSSTAILKGALVVGATAAGGGLLVAVGRSLMAACAGGPLAPSCVAASTELAVTAMETAGGVPTVGMTAAGTTAMASRLAHSASNATDVAAVVREARAVVGEAKAIESARLLNNLYRDGAPPDLIQKSYNSAAVNSTHNASASEVILGRYMAGSADSYDEVAKARGATYFSMSDWNNVSGQLGADKMWEINKAFLDQQIVQSKRFLFTQDPRLADPKSYTYKEFEHLVRSGFKIIKDGDSYVASKR